MNWAVVAILLVAWAVSAAAPFAWIYFIGKPRSH
jgi:hypothetical protein